MQAETPQPSYYQQRCDAIGLTAEKNKLCTPEHRAIPDSKIIEYPLFCEDAKTGDCIIPVYGLNGHPVNYYQDNPGKLMNGKTKPFEVRRYKPGNEPKDKDQKIIKYHTPKGAKTLPWISPNIIEAYNAGLELDTIVITEGYIKGISGFLNGLHIFALSGILNSKDKDTGTLHSDILEVVLKCKVKNVIVLFDGDANNISLNALNEGKDLYKRPLNFYNATVQIKELLKDHLKDQHFDIYFASINSSNLEDEPKGLDDLFETHSGNVKDITKELTSFSKQKSHYFTRINITVNTRKVLDFLHITNVDVFYSAHNQIIKDKDFVFHGTKYRYDEEKKSVKVIVPGAAKFYFRVGTNYYKHIKVPNKHGVLEYQYVKWQSGTIISDHGKDIIQHIQKFEAFCVKPDHINYQQIINNCFNRYRPFEHEVGNSNECPVTLDFIKHIFGEDQYELGLDYIQILLKNPQQTLPILCLVSKENNTGKSTFIKLLKAIFTGNMAIIGNSDLENDFNAGWADKLIAACEESFIDKKKTVEKVKSLSTGDKIQINQKGVDQVEIDCFIKFIFCSNNEDNFVIAGEHDERFWVRRVPKSEKENVTLLQDMISEIPNFLYLLNQRSLSTKHESRMHFDAKILRTDALRKLIEGNKSGMEKELNTVLKHLFSDTGFWKLELTLGYITDHLLRRKYEKNYVEKILRERFNLKAALSTKRFKYPEIQKSLAKGEITAEIVMCGDIGKPYTFEADKYLNADELEVFTLSAEAFSHGQADFAPKDVIERKPQTKLQLEDAPVVPGTDIFLNSNDDLPF